MNATDELIARFNQTNFLTDPNLISVSASLATASKASVVFANATDIAASHRRTQLLPKGLGMNEWRDESL